MSSGSPWACGLAPAATITGRSMRRVPHPVERLGNGVAGRADKNLHHPDRALISRPADGQTQTRPPQGQMAPSPRGRVVTPADGDLLGRLDLGGSLQAQFGDGDLAHLHLADLAGDGHREAVDELHVLGTLKWAMRPRQNSLISSPVASAPSRSLTQAITCSPYLMSGTPITWTSSMAGCPYRYSSISLG